MTLASVKGGVGKTTLAYALSCAAVAQGFKTIAVDLDPTPGLTNGLGPGEGPTIADAFLYGMPVEKILRESDLGVSYMPGSTELEGVAVSPPDIQCLVDALREHADIIILDTPPRRSFFEGPMKVADRIVIPTDMSDQGVNVAAVTTATALSFGLRDKIGGVVLNRVRAGTVVTEIRQHRVLTRYTRNLIDAVEGLGVTYETVIWDASEWGVAYSESRAPHRPQLDMATRLLDEILNRGQIDEIALDCFADSNLVLGEGEDMAAEDDDDDVFVEGA